MRKLLTLFAVAALCGAALTSTHLQGSQPEASPAQPLKAEKYRAKGKDAIPDQYIVVLNDEAAGFARRILFLAVATSLAGSALAAAHQPASKVDVRIDEATRQAVIESVIKSLKQSYVFPETAARMEADIRERASRGEYAGVTLGPALAELLTFHLREVSHDRHIHVAYSVGRLKRDGGQPSDDDEEYRRSARLQNYGFERVGRLPGNVGYLDLRGFYRAGVAGETAAAAMTFLSETDALIIDLRLNGGGNPSMVALLSTYLFEGEPLHLSDVFWRDENRTEQLWTLPYVPGKRYANKPVYVLTGGQTFSAGEALAYFLKSLKRATVIGETTAGAANGGRGHRIGDHFEITVPSGRVTSPITGSNWEGTGVEPDVKVPAGIALETAHLDALRKLAVAEKDSDRARQLNASVRDAERSLAGARAKLPPQIAPSVVGNTEFRLRGAGYARRVALVGSFNHWGTIPTECARTGGEWVCRVDLAPGRYTYKFVVDGMRVIDPVNRNINVDERGDIASVLTK